MGFYDIDDLRHKVDVGSRLGTRWSLSTSKPGHGVAALRDDDLERVWQSDGTQPHLVNIQFARRTALTHISIYLDHPRDDSYTPQVISVRAGTHYHDLVEVRKRTFNQPQGWRHFDLAKTDLSRDEEASDHEDSADDAGSTHRKLAGGSGHRGEVIHANLVQLAVLHNHLSGKDTHVRGLKVWGPAPTARQPAARQHKTDAASVLRMLDADDDGDEAVDMAKPAKESVVADPLMERAMRMIR